MNRGGLTEESSKAMSQPRSDAQGRPIRFDPRTPQGTPAPATQHAPAPKAAGSEAADTDMPSGPVRTVGPPFVPAR